MLAGILLLATVWVFLLRYVPDQARFGPGPVPFSPTRSDLLEAFAPRAAQALTVLLVFGLVGRMAAGRSDAGAADQDHRGHPHRRHGSSCPTGSGSRAAATSSASSPTPSTRCWRDSRRHVAEHERFAANASHELRTPLAITQTLLDVARRDPDGDQVELVDRLHDVNARAIRLTEALLAPRPGRPAVLHPRARRPVARSPRTLPRRSCPWPTSVASRSRRPATPPRPSGHRRSCSS